eukprot:gene30967-39875_t
MKLPKFLAFLKNPLDLYEQLRGERLQRDSYLFAVASLLSAGGFLHGFVNPTHERRVRDILAALLPDMPVSLACEVSPEMREWERFSTTAANAYVQPMMARYLGILEADLRRIGMTAPIFMMLSGG